MRRHVTLLVFPVHNCFASPSQSQYAFCSHYNRSSPVDRSTVTLYIPSAIHQSRPTLLFHIYLFDRLQIARFTMYHLYHFYSPYFPFNPCPPNHLIKFLSAFHSFRLLSGVLNVSRGNDASQPPSSSIVYRCSTVYQSANYDDFEILAASRSSITVMVMIGPVSILSVTS